MDLGSIPYFPIFQGKLPWQPNNIAKLLSTPTNTTCIRCTSARKRIAISWSCYAHWQRKWCLYIVWKFREILSSNSRVDRAHLWTSGLTGPKNWRISSNISGYIGPIFAIVSSYESALPADDTYVPYFPICQGALPWQPNNVAIMKANWCMYVCICEGQGFYQPRRHRPPTGPYAVPKWFSVVAENSWIL